MTPSVLATGSDTPLRKVMVQYYLLAQHAIIAGVITPKERDLISRVGTRKEGYWARHLYDLQQVLAERMLDKNKEAICLRSDRD